ncbi:TnpV protein [Candidatus Merdisoma sp. JLR.KK006]|uniref:TnpV protein n=1 Tax=Candidatus Merdisoma sp. JLR.KK006 TaxID=3112626 RepID=UPI002FEF1A61
MKSIFEQLGGTYHEESGYLIPDLELPAEKEKPIGVYGQRHLQYLKDCHKGIYLNLLISGRLNGYLADIDEQARDMFFRLVNEYAERQGVTEQLKAEDQMLWVYKINAVRNAAREVVNKELIFV